MEESGGMTMFIGEYHHCLDEKNRLTIPSPFRQALHDTQNGSVITKGLDRALFLYPFPEWQNLTERLKSMASNRADVRAFMRIFFSGAHPVDPDGQGRITVPLALKEFADIDNKVVVTGAFTKIEIWSEDLWAQYYQEKRAEYEHVAEQLLDLEL
jgi:MraZ protein